MKKNNDNFWKLHLPFAMTGGVVFVLALVMAMAHDIKKIKRMERAQNTKMARIDAGIKSANAQIDSLYNAVGGAVEDSLARHPEYQWVVDNAAQIDSLRAVNQNLVQRAYNAARKNSIMDIPRNDESVFSDFADVPGVKNVKWQYYANKNKIREFDRRAPFVAHLPNTVRAHFYLQANKQVHELQDKIDSLLDEKNRLIR